MQSLSRVLAAVESPRPEARNACARLSRRELQVLARVATGETNKHVARALQLSPQTIKRHVANILAKLDLPNRRQAAAVFRQALHEVPGEESGCRARELVCPLD